MQENQEDFKTNLKADFKEELKKLEEEQLSDPIQKRKKLVIWGIRTFLAVVLYIWFWHIAWVRWSLLLYIPLNLLGLFAIVGTKYMLKHKMKNVEKRIDKL